MPWLGDIPRRPCSGAEPTLPLTEGAQRPEEVNLAEVGPVGLAEVELTVRALPQEEASEALFPRRADDEVRVRLTLRVEVLGDVLDIDDLGELLDARASRGVLLEERAHGIRDLAPAAVAHGDVDEHALDVTGPVIGGLEAAGGRRGQEVEGTDGVDAPSMGVREAVHGSLDDAEQRAKLTLRTVEVVGREQPERDDLDPYLVAPRQEVGDVVGAGLVALAGAGAPGTRPPTVPVEHDPDVPRDRGGAELLRRPPYGQGWLLTGRSLATLSGSAQGNLRSRRLA